MLHGHCHQKSLMGMESDSPLLKKLRVELQEIGSGCCGMAGSFGFEKDKVQVSIACGERVRLPAVRQADSDTMILADGFSCREQISQLTNRHALHMAQVAEAP
jgi:Fe-S oxidoreductase